MESRAELEHRLNRVEAYMRGGPGGSGGSGGPLPPSASVDTKKGKASGSLYRRHQAVGKKTANQETSQAPKESRDHHLESLSLAVETSILGHESPIMGPSMSIHLSELPDSPESPDPTMTEPNTQLSMSQSHANVAMSMPPSPPSGTGSKKRAEGGRRSLGQEAREAKQVQQMGHVSVAPITETIASTEKDEIKAIQEDDDNVGPMDSAVTEYNTLNAMKQAEEEMEKRRKEEEIKLREAEEAEFQRKKAIAEESRRKRMAEDEARWYAEEAARKASLEQARREQEEKEKERLADERTKKELRQKNEEEGPKRSKSTKKGILSGASKMLGGFMGWNSADSKSKSASSSKHYDPATSLRNEGDGSDDDASSSTDGGSPEGEARNFFAPQQPTLVADPAGPDWKSNVLIGPRRTKAQATGGAQSAAQRAAARGLVTVDDTDTESEASPVHRPRKAAEKPASEANYKATLGMVLGRAQGAKSAARRKYNDSEEDSDDSSSGVVPVANNLANSDFKGTEHAGEADNDDSFNY